MSEHISAETIEKYRAGTLAAEEWIAVDAHITDCAECRAKIATPESLRRATDAWRETLQPQPTRWFVPLTVAAAIAIVAGTLLLNRRNEQPTHVPAIVHHTIKPPAPVATLDPKWQPLVREILSEKRAAILALLNPTAGRVRSGDVPAPEKNALNEPVGIVVEDARPEFRWTYDGDAVKVEIYDRKFHSVASSSWLHVSSWQPSKPLPRGEILTWQILVRKGGEEITAPSPPTPPARFQILDAKALAELKEVKRHDDPLVAGLIYAREGMESAAAAQFEKSKLPEAKRLLQSLRPMKTNPAQ
ncbi:MAG TPA: hypothetical protein VMU84_15555 [Thermoanaerobaculia bacterium]|nr:hypothetical protein [Thermoanaerobaculia bacterium]